MIQENSIGKTSKVFPDKIIIEVPDLSKINFNYDGDLYTCEGINTYVSIYTNSYKIFVYQISALYEQEKPYLIEEDSKFFLKSYFEAIPIGEINNGIFEFGLSSFPMINENVYLTSYEEMCDILIEKDMSFSIKLGDLSNDINFTPEINIDKLFTQHTAILGNTGSGKSTTLRKMIHEVTQIKNDNRMNIIVFDLHNEYSNVFNKTEEINLEDIAIPLNTLVIEDWVNLVKPSIATQLPFLKNALRLGHMIENNKIDTKCIKAYYALEMYNNVQTEAVTKRTKIIYLLKEATEEDTCIKNIIEEYNSKFGNLDPESEKAFKKAIEEYIKKKSGDDINSYKKYINENMKVAKCEIVDLNTLRESIDLTLVFEEVKGNSQIRSHCQSLVTRIENIIATYSNNLFENCSGKKMRFNKIMEFDKGITIFDCSRLPEDDLLFFTSYILKYLYKKQREENYNNRKISKIYNFIFDEAHKYIKEHHDKDSGGSINTFEIIAKEGRKFGLIMMIASQRPSELSSTVISQCNNSIFHRVRNHIDLDQIHKSIPYISKTQINRLSYLKVGSVIAIGEAFKIPMEIIIDGSDYASTSQTPLPSKLWFE